jgi:hypothetical protein
MTIRKEQEYILQEASRQDLRRGRIDRREFLTRSLVTGLSLAGISAAAKTDIGRAWAQDRPLTPTFYQWIEDLHPAIPAVNAKFPGINYQIAPVEGFGIERFVAEAKNKESTWDVYVGQTGTAAGRDDKRATLAGRAQRRACDEGMERGASRARELLRRHR